MSRARVSVVIATHNRVSLLGEAIASVLRQTYRDHEVIVCDDGSTDETAQRLEAAGPPVRYLRLGHTGRPGAVRNRGIEAARGEFVAFLDDDDLWETHKLARQVERMVRDPGLGLVYTDRVLLYPDGSRSDPVDAPARDQPADLLDLILDAEFPSLCTVLVRRDLLEQVGGFDADLITGEDLDLFLRLARFTRAARVPEPLVLVRRAAGSLSDRSGPLAYRTAIRLLRRELATGGLSRSRRARCRATLSRLHLRLARMLAASGDLPGARWAALRALRHSPASRSAWAGAARACLFAGLPGALKRR